MGGLATVFWCSIFNVYIVYWTHGIEVATSGPHPGWDVQLPWTHGTLWSSAETEVGSQSDAGTSVSAIPQPMLAASSARTSPGIPTSAHIPLGSKQHNQKHHPNFLVSFSLLYLLNCSSVLGVPWRCITSADELGLEGLYIRPIWLSGYYQLKTWCFPLSTLKCMSSFYIFCACIVLWRTQPGLFFPTQVHFASTNKMLCLVEG